ncbi:hypothetical protein SISNIDRAFT_459379 [Sistotremastrum niveocremeum HHB9708]|uniref:Uncharacterized protein n=1 Tax=Sistotremastrum niveocremeum HHB9708 TaxID=1314777 RepID=A0A164PIB7_9AGAM|nr:hypothetical protein SISNIDRAFT_459379 [Sistotremastrum niveocremeum HHB9708]
MSFLKSLFKTRTSTEVTEEKYDLLPRHSTDQDSAHEGSGEASVDDLRQDEQHGESQSTSRGLRRLKLFSDLPDHRIWMWTSIGLGCLSVGLTVGLIVCQIKTPDSIASTPSPVLNEEERWAPTSCFHPKKFSIECTRQREDALPQHNLDLPYPEGRTEELILNAYLSHRSNRSYAFRDFGNPHGTSTPAYPLNYMIGGTTAGAPFPLTQDGYQAPRFINQYFWEQVCPRAERVQLNTQVEGKLMGLGAPGEDEGALVIDKWVERLTRPDPENKERCVEMTSSSLFDFKLMDNLKVVSIWEELSKSPVLTEFMWSPMVNWVYERYVHSMASMPDTWQIPDPKTKYTIPGLLVVAIRRGDFSGHCHNLAWGALPFNLWAMVPALPDSMDRSDFPSKEDHDNVMRHCWPTEEQMMEKMREVRDYTGGSLKNVYVMSNGKEEYLEKLKSLLLEDGWENVVHTLSPEVKMVTFEEEMASVAVDMEIARRAEAFIGNGFSSVTSNVAMLRMMDYKDNFTTRFWKKSRLT